MAGLIPPLLQLGLETYISYPLYRIIDFFREDVVLLEELDVVLGISTDGLREPNGDGVKKIKVNGRVPLKLPTNDRVITPLDFDKVGNALAPIFSGDF